MSEAEVVSVDVRLLDDDLRDVRQLRFVKIDAEGGDFDVLRGMRRSLTTLRPIVVFESGKESAARLYNYTREEFFAFFEGIDYGMRDILGCPFEKAAWEVFQAWYVVAYPHELAGSTIDAHSLAIAENIIELLAGTEGRPV